MGSLPAGPGFLSGVMKVFLNDSMMTVASFCEYAIVSVNFKWVNFVVRKLYFNKDVFKKGFYRGQPKNLCLFKYTSFIDENVKIAKSKLYLTDIFCS